MAVSAGFWRLVTVALHRNQQYDNMGAIQAELSEKVMELAPPGLPDQQQVCMSFVWLMTGKRSV